jgi:hypothetical protein
MELRENTLSFSGTQHCFASQEGKWNTRTWEGPLWTGSGEVERAVFPQNSIFSPVKENILRP